MTNYFSPPNGDGRPIPFEGYYPDLFRQIAMHGLQSPKTKSEIDAWLEGIIEIESPEYYEI